MKFLSRGINRMYDLVNRQKFRDPALQKKSINAEISFVAGMSLQALFEAVHAFCCKLPLKPLICMGRISTFISTHMTLSLAKEHTHFHTHTHKMKRYQVEANNETLYQSRAGHPTGRKEC